MRAEKALIGGSVCDVPLVCMCVCIYICVVADRDSCSPFVPEVLLVHQQLCSKVEGGSSAI